jgi:hypothetical protein
VDVRFSFCAVATLSLLVNIIENKHVIYWSSKSKCFKIITFNFFKIKIDFCEQMDILKTLLS